MQKDDQKLFPCLSDDQAVGILSWLSTTDLARLSRVCRDARRLAHDHTLNLAMFKKSKALRPLLESKDVSDLVNHLRTSETADDIEAFIPDSKDDRTKCIHTLLVRCLLPQDNKFFLVINELLRRATPLPALIYKKSANKSEYFESICLSFHDLYIALHQTPNIIREQDEEGYTLLHHVIVKAFNHVPKGITSILQLLLSAPNLDLNIIDSEGDTPLHMIASCCHEDKVFPHFKSFIQKAIETGFDFSRLNLKGKSVLHCAGSLVKGNYSLNSHSGNNIAVYMIRNIPRDRLDIDSLSKDGQTTLDYLLQYHQFDAAKCFLQEGANPRIGRTMEAIDELLRVYGSNNRQLREIKQLADNFIPRATDKMRGVCTPRLF